MRTRPKFSKLYFPGLISLLLLPVICVIYISYSLLPQYFITDIQWESSAGLQKYRDNNREDFTSISVDRYIYQHRRFNKLTITGNAEKNKAVFEKAKSLIGQLISKKDTLNGVSIAFGTKANYADVVNAISICYENEHPNFPFRLIDDQLLTYYYKPQIKETVPHIIIPNIIMCGTGMYEYGVYSNSGNLYKSVKSLKENTGISASLWYVVFALWLFLFCAMLFRLRYSLQILQPRGL
ncbi:MAG: hypothetical protein EOO42_20570 [Flavobacteriales bacterium]|nr:MAG: hypothetical protein EOO42_20570 [Flavobacteriales bacterium]